IERKEDGNGKRSTQQPIQGAGRVNQSRRRFGKSGLAVTGVLATLASRPVLGTDLVCKSPSGFLSGNLSTHGPAPVCAGRSPGYWKNHKWPIPNRETAKFCHVFATRPGSPYA